MHKLIAIPNRFNPAGALLCALAPCANGGTCVGLNTCNCTGTGGWTGPTCSEPSESAGARVRRWAGAEERRACCGQG